MSPILLLTPGCLQTWYRLASHAGLYIHSCLAVTKNCGAWRGLRFFSTLGVQDLLRATAMLSSLVLNCSPLPAPWKFKSWHLSNQFTLFSDQRWSDLGSIPAIAMSSHCTKYLLSLGSILSVCKLVTIMNTHLVNLLAVKIIPDHMCVSWRQMWTII